MRSSGARHDGQLKVNDIKKGSNKLQGGRPPSSEVAWEALDQDLADKLAELAVTNEDLCAVQACLHLLQIAVSALSPGWTVRPFGSSANGFATRGSDLDVTCCRVSVQPGNGTPLAVADLQTMLLKVLEAGGKFQLVEDVREARVPILRLKFEQCLDVDLSFQNVEPLPNTQLLRAYAALDPRVRDLVVLVKLWAKSAGVAGAQNGHLSQYAWTLMAIYFLQVNPGSNMPCLSTAEFNGEAGIPTQARPPWSYPGPLSQLLAGFFQFFSEEFKWGKEVVSVRLGQRSMASEAVFQLLRGRISTRLHIEDPFLRTRNLHCVLRVQSEGTLHAKLQEAAHAMRQRRLPSGLEIAGPRECRSAEPEPKRADPSVKQAPEGELGNGSIGHNRCSKLVPKAEAVGASDRESSSTAADCRERLGSGEAEESEWSSHDREREELAHSPSGLDVASDQEVVTGGGPEVRPGPSPEEVPLTLLQGTWRL